MHSISDLTTCCRKTTGDVPPKLVGASTTVIGSKMYLFGGRFLTARRMVADLYVFDLHLFQWEKIDPHPGEDVPTARYFHTADSWNNQLVIFGGMANRPDSDNPEDLRVLNDVRTFDVSTRRWTPPTLEYDRTPSSLIPKARYAHLSSITANRLFIIGGQDLANAWLDDIHVYDLLGKSWVQRGDCSRHWGTYRSIAVSSDKRVRLPQEERSAIRSPSRLGPSGGRFKSGQSSPPSPHSYTAPESLMHLPYTADPTDEYPSHVYLYSNYNFSDVKRELEVFTPLPDNDFAIEDRSSAMSGSAFPPGLRFPSGAVHGTHLIVAGTYMAHSYQSFSIWALDLLSMTWSRIDAGASVSSGSWFRGCLWADSNKFIVFGNRNGNLVDDYNRRLLSWDHVAVVDLEAFGIYQAPPLKLDIQMQELGIAALEEDLLTDFEIICDDNRRVRCSREVLEDRWPWFREQRMKLLRKANLSLESLPASTMHMPITNLPGGYSSNDDRVDPRLTPRSFRLSEPYPVTLAFIQYFYSLGIITPLQHAPAVLSQLLVLSNTYQITHLETLVKHAMHRALSDETSVGVYEVATLCRCRSLQIRALKTVLAHTQKSPTGRSRRDTGSSGGGDSPGAANRRLGSEPDDTLPIPRNRAHSDVRPRGPPDPHLGYSSANRARAMTSPRQPSRFSSSASEASSNDSSYYGYTPPPPPPPISSRRRTRRNHEKSGSAVSTATDREIRSVAAFLSPVVMDARDYIAEEHEENVSALDDEYDSVHSSLHHLTLNGRDRMPRARTYGSERSYGPLSHSSQQASDSEVDAWSDDQLDYDPRLNEPPHPSFHMPSRNRPRYYPADGSDTPSLVSSASYSSLASTSWSSRPHYSPDRSPAMLPSSIREALAAPHLAIVEERDSDDYGVDLRRYASNGSATTFGSQHTLKDYRNGALPGERFLAKSSSAINATRGSMSPDPSRYNGELRGVGNVYPYSNRPATSSSSITSPSAEFSRYGGRGMRRVKAPKPPKSPKEPKEKPSIQKMTERLFKDDPDKKAQKAEAKKRKKMLEREREEAFAAGLATPETKSL